MRLSCALAVTLLFLAFGSTSALAQLPSEQFELARSAFNYQDHARVVQLLEPLLWPEPLLPTAEMILLAREWLGASRWWLDDKAGFRQEFTKLLKERPDFELDSFYYPPEMIADLETLRKQLVELRIIKPDRPPEPVVEIKERTVYLETTIERRSPLLCLLPLGAGQFYNGSPGKGAIFLSSQLLALSGNVGSWLYLYSEEPRESTRTAALAAMYGSLAVFAGLYGWSVADALINFVPETRSREKRLEMEEDSASMGRFFLLPSPAGPALGWGIAF